MDDSDSGVGSVSSIISTRTTSSMSGDDRSAAGSRSSAQSLSLSEVSSPAPQSNSSSTIHQDSMRVWREIDQATQIRHIQSVQHHPLMMTPSGHPAGGAYPMPMPLLLPPPPMYAADMWAKQQQQQHQGHARYEEEKHSRDRREVDYRDIERQKDMERERERVERQQQHERDRERERQAQQQQEKQITELAVTKHFEESLRRAKEKQQQQQQQQQYSMRPSWGINTIAQHQPSPHHHLVQQSHNSPSQQNQHQSHSNSPVSVSVQQQIQAEERRRQVSIAAEHERIYVDRELEKERERASLNERERLRHYFPPQPGANVSVRIQQQQQQQPQQRVQSKIDYSQSALQNQHRGLSASVLSSSQSNKSNEKIIPESAGSGQRMILDPSAANYKIYGYGNYPQPSTTQSSSSNSSPLFHKDLSKSKELSNSLPNPPPLMSDLNKPAGVIVKHDTNMLKSSQIQMVHATSKQQQQQQQQQQPPAHYTKVAPISVHGHSIYEYRTQPPSASHNDRYKASVTVMPTSQSYHIQQSQTPPSSQQQSQGVYSHGGGGNMSAVINKQKLPTPAPSHFYGKPAGIVSGIPVCRSQDVSVFVTKSSSPSSPFQPQYQGPPPAHSRTHHDFRIHQQPNVVVGSSGIVGVGKSQLAHSIPHHHPHHHSTSPPTQIPIIAPHSISSRSPGLMPPNIVGTPPLSSQLLSNQSVQTQPLDLGVSNRDDNSNSSSGSIKRKGTPIHHPMGSPVSLDVKKKRIENTQNSPIDIRTITASPHITASPTMLTTNNEGILHNLSKSINAEINHTIDITNTPSKSPIINIDSGGGRTIPSEGRGTPININTSAGNGNIGVSNIIGSNINNTTNSGTINLTINSGSKTPTPPSVNVLRPVTPMSTPIATTNITSRPDSESDGIIPNIFSSTNSSPSQSPGVSSITGPVTPAKSESSDKSSSSPAMKSTSSGPRHLKKAWLQRHTGEDFEDTTGITGSGSCLKLPLTINNNSNSTSSHSSTIILNTIPPVHSLHTIGSMAVNSINKSKPSGIHQKQSQSQQHPKKSLVNQNNFSNSSVGGGVGGGAGTGKDSNNGHNSDSDVEDNSSSSDQDRTSKNSIKRKSPKVKRRKGGVARKPDDLKKKKSAVSESDKDSDSEHDSISDKDSDSGTSTSQGTKKTSNGARRDTSNLVDNKEPRKRGRRPKTSSRDELKKKQKDEVVATNPFRKPPIAQLKKTGESFQQDGSCFEVAPKLAKCRECRWTPNQRSKNTPNIFCRFYAFRRLRYTKNGQLAIAGFSDPHKDPTDEDLKLWMPDAENPPIDLDVHMSRFLLTHVADQFCDLLQQEKEAMAEHMSDDKTIAWKRVVQGVREMCDVCETTLFNYHWACGKCGFVVCIDCYKDRKVGSIKIWGEAGKDRDECSWLLCTNRSSHEQEKLMLTQIIAGDSLQILGRRTHEARALWDIPQNCGCPLSTEQPTKVTNGLCKELIKSLIRNDYNGIVKKEIKSEDRLQNGIKSEETNSSALSWLADVALSNEDKKNGRSSNDDKEDVKKSIEGNQNNDDSSMDGDDYDGIDYRLRDNNNLDPNNSSTLRELLIRPSSGRPNGSRTSSPIPKPPKKTKLDSLDEVITSVIENSKSDDEIINDKLGKDFKDINKLTELKHFIGKTRKMKNTLPTRVMNLVNSTALYPNVPHSWLCDGKLLRLLDPTHPGNYKIFQDQWKRGQPVLVSDVAKSLNSELWHPSSFSRDFGDGKNDLINCITGNLLPKQSMRKFWDGFEDIAKRIKDDKNVPMLLKLKDWPPGDDFAEMLPTRFNDLMKALPLGDYTNRNGQLNLASRLPDCFVRPDLGPKMYNAYGSAVHIHKGTTNLHLDISDAVNVMVYIGIPEDDTEESCLKANAYKAIDEANCDILMRRRVRDKGETVGAIWHIYAAKDADKIRDLLNKVALERGEPPEPHHDPIHDQSWYLDGPLRERLFNEYGVEGYPIAQCLGDAVFIPAGAPHQVRNLHSCIKVAEDFVSPENIYHCFHLTHEFRELSDTHSNHEDKLQIKNIIYHAVKDAIACLSHLLGQCITESQSMELANIKHEIKEVKKEECDNDDV